MNNWKCYIQPPQQGIVHKKNGDAPCQDAAMANDNGVNKVIVLCDGVGEYSQSQVAASAVSEKISSYLQNYNYSHFSEDKFKENVLNEAICAIKDAAEKSGEKTSNMDCTLLFVVVRTDVKKYITGQLGDGAICWVTPSFARRVPYLDDNGKFSSNMVKTVQSKDALKYFFISDGILTFQTGFFVTSDGLANEIYTNVGGAKHTLEDYFNWISNNQVDSSMELISERWSYLTSDEKYGFTDDISLAAIVEDATTITLPEEPTWLCVCGNRNRLESTRCEKCSADFLQVYKGVKFKEIAGSKFEYFKDINRDFQREVETLHQHSTLEISTDLMLQEKNALIDSPDITKNDSPSEKHPPIKMEMKSNSESEPQAPKNSQCSSSENGNVHAPEETETISFDDVAQEEKVQTPQKVSIMQKLNVRSIILNFLCALLVFIVGFYSALLHYQRMNTTSLIEQKQLLDKIELLEDENSLLESKNSTLEKVLGQITLGNGEYKFYYSPNGDLFKGEMDNELPNGVGILYSSNGSMMIGTFKDGLKDGAFYSFSPDGKIEQKIFEKDTEIDPSSMLEESDDGEDNRNEQTTEDQW